MKPLKTGCAYHGTRMLNHVENDMRDMAASNMNLVVHMMSHNDWTRHFRVMKDIVKISQDAGLEVWMDNWGLGGPPGEISHFLAFHPEAHRYYSNGDMDPTRVCMNSPEFRKFMRNWIDAVKETGATTIFWDEPHLDVRRDGTYDCCCERCRKMYEEKTGKKMPLLLDDEVKAFRMDTVVDFFEDLCGYASSIGLKNAVCVMLGERVGVNLESLHRLCAVKTLENIGSDPYWGYTGVNPYEFVYNGAKKNLAIADEYQKDHNLWIQAYGTPAGREEEIIQATEGAYDAGARTILAWSYFAGISNDYAAKNAYVAQSKLKQAYERIWNMERDRILRENRKLVGLEK